MNQIYKPGTLVTALYKSFDGKAYLESFSSV